jgi:hypothetical protein
VTVGLVHRGAVLRADVRARLERAVEADDLAHEALAQRAELLAVEQEEEEGREERNDRDEDELEAASDEGQGLGM